MPSVATWIQNPAVVGVPTLSAQKAAIPICSVVRVSEICRISPSAARNADDPNAGGGPGRNWLGEVKKDRKSTRLNSSHVSISYAVFCLKKKNKKEKHQ